MAPAVSLIPKTSEASPCEICAAEFGTDTEFCQWSFVQWQYDSMNNLHMFLYFITDVVCSNLQCPSITILKTNIRKLSKTTEQHIL
jgi:hypothetical protein